MSFLTTVKATGELFDAITDLGVDKKLTGDAQLPLQPMNFYDGNHLKGSVPDPARVRIENGVFAVFRGDELAEYRDVINSREASTLVPDAERQMDVRQKPEPPWECDECKKARADGSPSNLSCNTAGCRNNVNDKAAKNRHP